VRFRYSPHLLERLAIRRMPRHIPQFVFDNAQVRLTDTASGRSIAVLKVNLKGRDRDMALVYQEDNGVVSFITLHPLKEGQLKNRINSGRWKLPPQVH